MAVTGWQYLGSNWSSSELTEKKKVAETHRKKNKVPIPKAAEKSIFLFVFPSCILSKSGQAYKKYAYLIYANGLLEIN